MILLVTGASGQLGQSFQKISLSHKGHIWHFADRQQLDITDQKTVFQKVSEVNPDIIINCAAYTAVDKAESESEKAYLINDIAVGYLATAAKENGCILIHYSSDYVYHNKQKDPLKETDPKHPSGIYAKSKLAGEQKIIQSGAKSIIIRTSWVYSEFGNNFLKTMLRLGRKKKEISIVNDQIGCPTYATDIAEDTMVMISKYPILSEIVVVTNYTADGKISWYDFANEIFRITNTAISTRPIKSISYPTPAKRPKNSMLDLTYFAEISNLKIRSWKDTLSKCMSDSNDFFPE